MRLDGPESSNVEDRRGGGGAGGGRLAVGGLGGVVLVVLALVFGIDPRVLLQGDVAPAPQQREAPRYGRAEPAQHDAGRRFVAQVLQETEQVWQAEFARLRRPYAPPTLVLFSGATQSGCGYAQAQTGPFYCPNDQKVYIDLDFMAQLQRTLGAQGDFAAAYIIAHEVGHHVQNQLGVLQRAEQLRARGGGNAAQVRVELQADCLAGLWANRISQGRNILEPGDIEEGLNAAAAVGDDRIQRRSQGRVTPDSFTHGSSAQRVGWFKRGYQAGRLEACDTFATRE